MFLFCCYKKRRLSLEIFNLYQTRFLLAKCHQQKYDRNADKRVSDLHKKVLHLQSAEFFSPSDYETSFYFSCIGQMRFFFWLNLINMFKETIFFIFLCVDMFHTSSACVDTLDWKLRQACRFGRFCQNSNSGTCIFFSKLIKLTFMFLKVVIFSWIFLRSLNAWKESRKNWTRAWKWKHCEQFRPWCFIKFLNLILFVIMNKNYCCQGGRTMTRVTRD